MLHNKGKVNVLTLPVLTVWSLHIETLRLDRDSDVLSGRPCR